MVTKEHKVLKSLAALFFSLSLVAVESVENYDSGRLRVQRIMSNDETGIAAYNRKNIKYAESKNLEQDLNVPDIVNFFACKTVIGQSYMEQSLLCPISPQDKHVVMCRQNAIRVLVENAALRQRVGELLEEARQDEQEIVKLMSEFFIGKNCPELKNLEVIKKDNPWLYPFFNFLLKNPTGKTVLTALGVGSLLIDAANTGYYGKLVYKGYGKEAGTMAAFWGLLLAFESYVNYKDYTQASEKRKKIHALNQLISIAESLDEICRSNSIETQFSLRAITHKEGLRLIEQLKHPRYKDEKALVFFTAATHTFLYDLYEHDKNLSQLFACVAEMDVYHAVATKIVESQEQKNKLCFVSYLEDVEPAIKAQGFWSVLVKNAVNNNLVENRHIILTGPNAGGKSTTIRALLQNVLLGQTFGVAAAEKFEFTMFDVIYSYLHVSDDLIKGLSLFASEIKRAKELLERITSLGQGQKFFFALDELFTGTVAEDGEACAVNFVQKLAGVERILFVYATHFNRLKEVSATNAHCVNYKVDAPVKDDSGKLVYPFTLNRGASQANVALDLAREAGLFI